MLICILHKYPMPQDKAFITWKQSAMMQIEKPSVRRLIEAGIGGIGPTKLSREFSDYITQKNRWAGEGLDWRAFDNVVQTNTALLSDEELGKFFDETTLSKYSWVAIIYSSSEPCMLIPYAEISKQFDALVVTPHCWFVGISDDATKIANDDFVEYRMGSKLLVTGFKRERNDNDVKDGLRRDG